MRVLVDECVPRRLRRGLPGHEVRTAREMGWGGKRNGELLTAAVAAGFEVLLTADQNLRHQQNWRKVGLAAVVLVAPDNSPESLEPLLPQVLGLLPTLRPGQLVEVTADGSPEGEEE